MKIRQGFVSNSSTSSFIVKKNVLTNRQIELIRDHAQMAHVLFPMTFGSTSIMDAWDLTETADEISGATTMDNFDMFHFMGLIGVNDVNDIKEDGHIEWESW